MLNIKLQRVSCPLSPRNRLIADVGNVPHRAVSLGEESLALKTAAMGAYASQAHILKKFPTCHVEHYRVAPVYDFGKPSPPPYSRWDSRGYQPTTAMWRLSVADAARQLREVAA